MSPACVSHAFATVLRKKSQTRSHYDTLQYDILFTRAIIAAVCESAIVIMGKTRLLQTTRGPKPTDDRGGWRAVATLAKLGTVAKIKKSAAVSKVSENFAIFRAGPLFRTAVSGLVEF